MRNHSFMFSILAMGALAGALTGSTYIAPPLFSVRGGAPNFHRASGARAHRRWKRVRATGRR